MNKKEIDKLIPQAYQALIDLNVAKLNKNKYVYEISSTFKGYISNFGAAITMGSFKAAIAFFSRPNDNNRTKEDRSCLAKAIYYLITGKEETKDNNLLTWACEDELNEQEKREQVLNCVIALKLAMNRFKIPETEE